LAKNLPCFSSSVFQFSRVFVFPRLLLLLPSSKELVLSVEKRKVLENPIGG
jgi:hypothetical protein